MFRDIIDRQRQKRRLVSVTKNIRILMYPVQNCILIQHLSGCKFVSSHDGKIRFVLVRSTETLGLMWIHLRFPPSLICSGPQIYIGRPGGHPFQLQIGLALMNFEHSECTFVYTAYYTVATDKYLPCRYISATLFRFII